MPGILPGPGISRIDLNLLTSQSFEHFFHFSGLFSEIFRDFPPKFTGISTEPCFKPLSTSSQSLVFAEASENDQFRRRDDMAFRAFRVRQRVLDHEGDSAQLKACLKLLFSEDEETPKGNCFTNMHHIVYTWVLDHEFEAIYKIFLGAFCEVVEESMMAKELKQIALTQGKREFLTRLVAHWEKAMKVVTVIRDSFAHYIRRVTSGSYTYDNLEKELCARPQKKHPWGIPAGGIQTGVQPHGPPPRYQHVPAGLQKFPFQ